MNKEMIKQAKSAINSMAIPQSLKTRFIENGMSEQLEDVYIRTAALFEENCFASKALSVHLKQILPCIAFYEALLKKTGNKEEALKLYDEWAFDKLLKASVTFKKVMSTGLYRIAPFIADKLLDSVFGPDAGFKSRTPENTAPFARDMLVCPYYEICKKYNCPEIAQFFCKSDDITYGNMHPKLIWGRTKTLATGGDCCDFRLHLKNSD
ncbi:MAG: L-2-amino-thiazoline-4-carboxylic acid hydrolase [Oscillospiraceae bacterium]|nr:L-2-amino-thiazoline-4-carboxylic acid hydrolase [Oscillospiraceae bacterium]